MKVTKIRLKEDTVRNSDGTWSNKGDEGSHGKFKTKKKADAQRKAMFANGYKESLTEERLNPLKLSVMKALDFLDEYSFPFPGDDLLADNWHNAKEGIEMGIDPLEETAEFLIGYMGDLFDDIDPDLYNEAKDCYEDILEYSGKGVSITDESLFLEKQGDSAKLDQNSKKYIADPTANVINSLLGLQKRQKKSFFGANGSGGSGGNGSWDEKTVVTLGDRNFELMCKKYGFLQKDFNIHNVLRREAKKGIKLGDLAWRIKNEGSTRKDVKWIEKAIMKWVAKNESLTEAWFTPLSEMSSFTGWMDDDKIINEEERFNSKVERALKTKRGDIQVLIDEDFQYDPRTYSIEGLTPVQEIKTKNIHANKFIVNGIEFIFEDAGSSSSPRLYFKSEEDGEAYTNYIDHFYDEEM